MDRFPDIIFLDLNMPMMDGWEFFDIFKRDFAHFAEKTKFFILSGVMDILEAGFEDLRSNGHFGG